MPDAHDGDDVTPRHHTGPASTSDAVFRPLLDLGGWELHNDDSGNAHLISPCRQVRLSHLPEEKDEVLWSVAAYTETDPASTPYWGVRFTVGTPVGVVVAFSEVLAALYGDGYHLLGPPGTGASPYGPLLGWQEEAVAAGFRLRSRDGTAQVTYANRSLLHDSELTTRDARWLLEGGTEPDQWYITASTHTPGHLITAVTEALAAESPLPPPADGLTASPAARPGPTPTARPGPRH